MNRIKNIREVLARADSKGFRGGGLLRAFDTVLGYSRQMCWQKGHVRTGIGDTDICSRCGDPVDDTLVADSVGAAMARRDVTSVYSERIKDAKEVREKPFRRKQIGKRWRSKKH